MSTYIDMIAFIITFVEPIYLLIEVILHGGKRRIFALVAFLFTIPLPYSDYFSKYFIFYMLFVAIGPLLICYSDQTNKRENIKNELNKD